MTDTNAAETTAVLERVPHSLVAVVVIGRNEGKRLVQCLESVISASHLVIYVDSGSTDDSVVAAEGRGVRVVKLDLSIPFTAARARNAGLETIRAIKANPRYIQFVDGDCEVAADWLQHAVHYLDTHASVAAVCGQRTERFPEASIYNELCDYEWRKPPGNIDAFGGDVLIRTEALENAGGYRDSLIAGEEPELSLRLRKIGWELHALDQPMTLHDANITRFSQWWRRMKRSGYAYAAAAHLYGIEEGRHWVWRAIQAWVWVPIPLILSIYLSINMGPIGLLVLLVYPLQAARLFLKLEGSIRKKLLLAISIMIAKFPEFSGQLNYLSDATLRKTTQLIEYK